MHFSKFLQGPTHLGDWTVSYVWLKLASCLRHARYVSSFHYFFFLPMPGYFWWGLKEKFEDGFSPGLLGMAEHCLWEKHLLIHLLPDPGGSPRVRLVPDICPTEIKSCTGKSFWRDEQESRHRPTDAFPSMPGRRVKVLGFSPRAIGSLALRGTFWFIPEETHSRRNSMMGVTEFPSGNAENQDPDVTDVTSAFSTFLPSTLCGALKENDP